MSTLAITILTLVAKYGPDVVQKIVAIAHNPEATKEDWYALFSDIKALDYDKAIAAAQARAT
jgi:hypothetical protein